MVQTKRDIIKYIKEFVVYIDEILRPGNENHFTFQDEWDWLPLINEKQSNDVITKAVIEVRIVDDTAFCIDSDKNETRLDRLVKSELNDILSVLEDTYASIAKKD